jgi:hypothetical protein
LYYGIIISLYIVFSATKQNIFEREREMEEMRDDRELVDDYFWV